MVDAAFPANFIQEDLPCYGFIIRDDSFYEERMQQDDLIAIEVRQHARSGETVLVTTGNGQVFVSKYLAMAEQEGIQIGTTFLAAEELHIHGALIALIRGYTTFTSSAAL